MVSATSHSSNGNPPELPRRLRAAIVGFSAAIVVLVLGLIAYDTWNDRSRDLEQAGEAGRNLARTLENHTTQTVELVDRVLGDLGQEIAGLKGTKNAAAKVAAILRRATIDLTFIRRIVVLDPSGRVVHDSRNQADDSVDYGRESYFTEPRDLPSTNSFISAPVETAVADRWVFAMSRRIGADHRQFNGVIVAFIDPSYFQRIYDALDVGRDGLVQLVRRDGTTLARQPFNEDLFRDQAPSRDVLRQLIQRQRDGVASIALPPDEIPRIVSYRSIAGSPVVVIVGLSLEEVLGPWREEVRMRAILAATIVAAVVLLTYFLLRNLASRQASEAALRDSETRFDLTARGTSEALWEWDLAKDRVWFAPRLKELLRYPPGVELPEDGGLQVMGTHPDDCTRRDAALDAHLRLGAPYDVECRLRTHDGGYRWFRVRGEAIRDSDGLPVRMAGSISDVDAKHAAEGAVAQLTQTLQDSKEKLSTLIENVPGVIYRSIHHAGDEDVLFNEAIAELTGYPPAHFRSKGARVFSQIVHPDDRDRLLKTVDAAAERMQDFVVEYRIIHRDGGIRWVWERGRPVRAADNDSTYIDGCIFDFSDRKQAEIALQSAMENAEAANAAKSRFLAHFSHELRTPLNAIIGFSDVMRREDFGPIGSTQYREYAGDINKSGELLLAMINDILDLSKIEAGQTPLREESCDIGALIADCALLVGKSEVPINRDVDAALPSLWADQRLLKQVLLNLLSNAIKFTPAPGTVTVSARRDGNDVQIIVKDEGIGIPADQLARVMEPFTQVEHPFRRTYRGTGLGLPIARAFVQLHGGSLALASALGAGTTATVTLPGDRLERQATVA